MSEKKEGTEEAGAAPKKQAPKRPAEAVSPRSPAPKRKRKPAELYQSDVIDACSKQIKTSQDKREVFLPRGGYVAVRSEDGFYLCQVLHYVYDDSVGPIQIQWMEEKSKGVYELDYMDVVEREAVLTEVRLNSAGERGMKVLPSSEKERIDKILGFSLQKEKGLLEGVDSSNLAEAVTASISQSKKSTGSGKNSRRNSSSQHKNDTVENGDPPASEAEPSTSRAAIVAEAKKISKPSGRSRGSRSSKDSNPDKEAVVKLKHITPSLKLHKVEDKVTPSRRKSKGNKGPMSPPPAKIKAGKDPLSPPPAKSSRQNNRGLKPNLDVPLVTKDRVFESKNEKPVPDNSKLMLCKRAIHAVHAGNIALLQRLIEDRANIPSVFVDRSVDVRENALLCAMRLKNSKAFDLLAKELFSKADRIPLENPLVDKSQPKGMSYIKVGHKTKYVNAAKGTKEGNLAFARDMSHFNAPDLPYSNIVQFAMKHDVPLSYLEKLAVLDPAVLPEMQQNAYVALRSGHRLLAGEVIKTCQGKENIHGFHKLHEQVLLVDSPDKLSHASAAIVRKKSSSNSKVTPFHCAAINPNAKILAHLLTFFAGDTLTDQHGWTLLHYAAACTGPAPLALLLSRGVSADTCNCKGLTPLMVAAKLGRLQNVTQLLKPIKGHTSSAAVVQNADKRDNNGHTALHYAAHNGHVEICKLLIKHGVDLDCTTSPNRDKVTPLMMAARKGHSDIVQTLVELGCQVEGKDKFKRTPLIHAVMNGHEPVAAFLLRSGASPNNTDSSHNSPLHYAAGYGWWYCVKLLLQAGADPKYPNDAMVTPLWVAFVKGHLGCVDLILKEPGVDINCRDMDGWSLLMLTVAYDLTLPRLEQLTYLVEEIKADPTKRDYNGWNPEQLEPAELERHEEVALQMASVLIKGGCNPSACTSTGESALSIAVKQKHLNSSLIHCFIENGAQLSLDPNQNGENILHVMSRGVKDASQMEMFDLLTEMLRKPELKKEVNSKPPTPANKVSQPPNIKDSASPAQMPILEQEANHVGEKDAMAKEVEDATRNLERVNDGKSTLDNGLKTEAKQQNHRDPVPPVVAKAPPPPPAKVEQTPDIPMEVDGVPGAETKGKGAASPVPRLVQLAQGRDRDGYTPLHRLCQEYKDLCEGQQRKNLKEDVISLMKAFIEKAKPDINLLTEITGKQKDAKKESKSCLHILAQCKEQPKESKPSVLEVFLSYKPDLRIINVPYSRTPLMEAIREKKLQTVDTLLEAGADINYMSPLTMAAQMGELTLVGRLLGLGANAKSEDPVTKDTPLHFIASSSYDPREVCALIKVLVDAGADINARNALQRTPLHLGVNAHSGKADSSSQVVEFLLDNGADPFVQDSTGSIPLHIAFSKYHNVHNENKAAVDPIEVVCALTAAMKNEKIDTPDNNGNTPLHRAAQHGATISCMHLIKRVPNINAKNILDNTPLNLAVSMKQEGTTIALLQNDNVDVTNPLKVRARKYAEWEHKIEKFNKYWHWDLMKPWQPLKTFNFSLISQVVQRQWHGVLFLLMDHLDRAGLSKTAVVEAAIDESRFQLALSLLSKIKSDKDVQAVNSQGQNLLHILMYIMPTKTTPLHLEVGKELLRRGVGLGLDKHRCSPLTYAALDQSAEFCRMLFEYRKEDCLCLLGNVDLKGRSPLAAVFWRLDNDMQQLEATLRFLLDCGATLDQNMPLPRRDLILQEPEMDPDDFYLFWDGPVGQFSPLIAAILARDRLMVKLLLELGADPNFADPDRVTPLMHAVRMNDLGIIKLLFGFGEGEDPRPAKRREEDKPAPQSGDKKIDEPEKMEVDSEPAGEVNFVPSKINPAALDKNRRGAVHYMVNTCDYGTYENEEVLDFFAKCQIPLDSKDSTGKTILDHAEELRLEKIVKALCRVLKVTQEVSIAPAPLDEAREPPPHSFNLKTDAGRMLDWLKARQTDTSTPARDMETEVDADSGCNDGSTVLRDRDQDIPYSVFLTVVDVKQGHYGMNGYYKMQIIYQKDEASRESYMLFTKSGRLGSVGQHQRTPYNSVALAIEEFTKIFKSKTGNYWSQYKDFKPIRGKHKLISMKTSRPSKPCQKLHLETSACPPSNLPAPIKSLMSQVTQQGMLESVQASCHIDMNLVPFGRLEEDILISAKGILDAIRGLLSEYKSIESSKAGGEELGKKHTRMQDIMEKVSDMTLEFHQLIPYAGYSLSSMQPLHTLANLQAAERDIEMLMDLELTGKILLGAQFHHKEMHLLDYAFSSLECRIEPLLRTSNEAQLILQQIATSGRDVYRSINIETVYKLTRRGEQAALNALGISNHKLLWHGTKAGNLLTVLKRGLVQSHSDGSSMLPGKGICLTDTFSKCLQYCDVHQKQSRVKFMLLCEVALGKDDIPEKPGDSLAKGYHHIKGEGSVYPDPRFDLRLPSGVVISMGKLLQRKGSLEFNEFVVQNEAQVCLRYLLQYSQEEQQ